MKKNYPTIKTLAAFLLIGTAKLSAQYCATNLGGSLCSGDNITNVTILNTTLNNNSGCFNGTNGTYSSFPPGPGTTCNLIAGFTYTMSIFTTVSNIESFWIDYDHSGTWDPTEWTQPTISSVGNAATLASFTVPLTALTGTTGLRVRSRGVGNTNGMGDACTNFGSGETEDYTVTIIPATPCFSVPAANSIVAPNYIVCPNGATMLSLLNNYTVTGITYQWQSAPNQVGPYTAVPNATNNFFVPAPNTLTTSTFYNAVITCPTIGTITTAAGQITIAATTTNTVPYYESFEGIPFANKLPNCSWSAPNLGTTALTYTSPNTQGRVARTGTSFASFFNSPAATSYFYTNGIYLTTGITYSASLWYQTEYFGYNNWSDLSILYGTAQSTTGLTSIASSNGPAVSNIYKELANTFSVATSGLYYFAIRATGNSGSAPWLTWDDLSITIPCNNITPNTPTVSLLTNATTICKGEPVNILASGADTYSWSTGDNTSNISTTPQVAGTYVYGVVGTNALSGCTIAVSQSIIVNAVPDVYLLSPSPSVCAGSTLVLTAIGAMNYTWSTGSNAPSINVSITTPTTYSLFGSNTNGCVGSTSQLVGVYNLPNVTVSSNLPAQMCVGENAILTAAGSASSFIWISNTYPTLSGNPVTVNPSVNTTFTVTGTDVNGCMNKNTIVQNVDECTSLRESSLLSGVRVYPNPTAGVFNIELNSASDKTIVVTDLTGRTVLTTTSSDQKITLNISHLANGVYYVKINSGSAVEVLRIVKN